MSDEPNKDDYRELNLCVKCGRPHDGDKPSCSNCFLGVTKYERVTSAKGIDNQWANYHDEAAKLRVCKECSELTGTSRPRRSRRAAVDT